MTPAEAPAQEHDDANPEFEVMNDERCGRLLLQLLRVDEGLEEGEARKACGALGAWYIDGVLFQMWDEGKIELRWLVEAQDFELRMPA